MQTRPENRTMPHPLPNRRAAAAALVSFPLVWTGLRAQPVADKVATVDSADTAVGQVTTVLALARSLKVQGGSFGASGSDGAVPLG